MATGHRRGRCDVLGQRHGDAVLVTARRRAVGYPTHPRWLRALAIRGGATQGGVAWC